MRDLYLWRSFIGTFTQVTDPNTWSHPRLRSGLVFWDNKKVWCVPCFSLGGCCCSNVIAEGTDRCEGLNLTRCKSHKHTHTHTHGRRHNMCAHACLDLSLLSGAAGLPPGFSPLSTVGVFLPCKTKLMIEFGWEAVCVSVCVCVRVCVCPCVCVSEQWGL